MVYGELFHESAMIWSSAASVICARLVQNIWKFIVSYLIVMVPMICFFSGLIGHPWILFLRQQQLARAVGRRAVAVLFYTGKILQRWNGAINFYCLYLFGKLPCHHAKINLMGQSAFRRSKKEQFQCNVVGVFSVFLLMISFATCTRVISTFRISAKRGRLNVDLIGSTSDLLLLPCPNSYF